MHADRERRPLPGSRDSLETLAAEACELFCGRRDPALIRRVADEARSPYEIPYAFLDPGTPLARGEMPRGDVAPTARHVTLAYLLLLQRHPESDDVVAEHLATHDTMTALLRMFLLGDEYRRRGASLIEALTRTVPRVWHVHIPKTAGTSFARAFTEAGWAAVNATDLADPAFPIADFAQTTNLRRLRTGALFTGHQSLPTIASMILPFDLCVAFIRHPVDRAISYFNYMTTRLAEDPEHADFDTRDFFARGLDPTSFERTYIDGHIIVANEQCAHLAAPSTARAALEQAKVAHCRLYDHTRVATVLESVLGVTEPKRHNVSRPGLRREQLSPALLQRILADNAEDLALYEAVRST